MKNILNQIITKKKEKIIDYKKKYSMNKLLDNIKNINIDKKPRSKIKPSDHTPIELELN